MFTVRVVLEVETARGTGDDSLELIIRDTIEAKNAVDAMRKVAVIVEAEVGKRLGI